MGPAQLRFVGMVPFLCLLDGFSEDWADWPGRVGVEMLGGPILRFKRRREDSPHARETSWAAAQSHHLLPPEARCPHLLPGRAPATTAGRPPAAATRGRRRERRLAAPPSSISTPPPVRRRPPTSL
jgi:hypothetical protein